MPKDRATHVEVTEDNLIAEIDDGRAISVPVAWYPRLLEATLPERNNIQMIGNGEGFHWPDLDEDISVENLLFGRPSDESASSLAKWLEARRANLDGVQ